MITPNVARAAETVAYNLKLQGISVTAKENTPLQFLTYGLAGAANLAITADGISNEDSIIPSAITAAVQASMAINDPQNRLSDFDEKSEHLTKLIVNGVTATLNLARNVAIPYISEVVEAVEKAYSDKVNAVDHGLHVVTDGYSKIWDNARLYQLVERFEKSAFVNVPAPNNYPELPVDKILYRLQTGVKALDEDVTAWVNDVGTEFVVNLYNNFYRVNPGKRRDTVSLTSTELDILGGRDALIGIYLLGNGLSRSLPDGVAVELTRLEMQMAQWLQQVGARLTANLEGRERAVKSKQLVVRYPGGAALASTADPSILNAIVVNNDVYKEFLEEGGSPEVLFGSYLTNQSYSYSELLARSNDFTNAWNRELALIKTRAASNKLEIVRKAIHASIATIINRDADQMEGFGGRPALHEKLAVQVNNLYLGDLTDIYTTVRGVISRLLFENTDVPKVLSAMAAATDKDESNESIRHVAAAVTLDLIVEWLCKMASVTRVE